MITVWLSRRTQNHKRSVLGHLRYDTEKELEIINDIYGKELRLYKNFFQPVMKLKEKIRDKGKVHRKYDVPKTPYQRLMESDQIPEETKKELRVLYLSLNPAQLRRNIEMKLGELHKAYQEKNKPQKVEPFKKQKPRMVTNYMT